MNEATEADVRDGAKGNFSNCRKNGIGGRKLGFDMPSEEKMAFRLMLEASQGRGMASIKDWLQQRFASSDLINTVSKSQAASKNVTPRRTVITPSSVPEFVIPGTTSLPSSPTSNSLKETQDIQTPLVDNFNIMKLNNNLAYTNSAIRQSNSIHENANQLKKASNGIHSKRSEGILDTSKGMQYLDPNVDETLVKGTNDDPASAAAVSLSHLRTHTSFGFTTVKESPHTRRKESLLLGSASMGDLQRFTNHKKSSGILSPTRGLSTSKSSFGCNTLLLPGSQALSSSMLSLLSDNGSTLSDSPPASFWTKHTSKPRLYQRRRSSVQVTNCSDSDTSAENAISVQNRELTKEQAHQLATFGEIKFSLVYGRSAKTLTLSIIKAEQLAKGLTQRQQLCTYVKICLLPDKKQRFETKSIKGTHDPHFNEEFTFRDMTLEDIEDKAVRMRIYNKKTSMTQELLGEVILPLGCLGLQHGEEVRMWRDLEPRSTTQNLGSINLTVKFDPREDRMFVTVTEARSLPKSITGQPDPYVCVSLSQMARPALKKQTRIRKATSHPVFKETFEFPISPKIDDLKYTTIHIVVMSRETIRNDLTIGEVKLGYGSIEEHEHYHWTKALSSINMDVQQWHDLSPLQT